MNLSKVGGLLLQTLKLASIAVGTFSGLIGTLTQTKDQITGKPTAWGRKIVWLLILSGIVSIATQSVESALKEISDRHQEQVNDDANKRIQAILLQAEQIGTQSNGIKTDVDNQQATLSKTVLGVEQTARNLDQQKIALDSTLIGIENTSSNLISVSVEQKKSLKYLYALTHPLGTLHVVMSVIYPLNKIDNSWQKRVMETLTENGKWIVTQPDDPLMPSPINEKLAYNTLTRPRLIVTINKTPIPRIAKGYEGGITYDSNHKVDLLFENGDFASSAFTADSRQMTVFSTVTMAMNRSIDDLNVRSLLDLYGAEITVSLTAQANPFSRFQGCTLFFGGDYGAESARAISLPITEANFRQDGTGLGRYVIILTEKELGPKPNVDFE